MTRWDERGERWGEQLEERPARTLFKWLLMLCAAGLTVAVVVAIGGWVFGWFNAAKNVAGPANVQEQYHAVIGDWNALQAAAGNYCQAKDAKQGPNSPSLVEDPAFAYAAQYRHVTVDYDERQNNIFEAGAVGPSGYPRNAPPLSQMTKEVC